MLAKPLISCAAISGGLGLVREYPADFIPPLRIFNGIAAQALQSGFADYSAEDFRSDYVCKKMQAGYAWMDEIKYIKIASARMGRFCDPMTGKARIVWARSADGDNGEGGAPRAVQQIEAPELQSEADYAAQDAAEALSAARIEKAQAFLRKIDPKKLAKILNITERRARTVRADIIARIEADHKNGLFGVDPKRLADYIPAPKVTPKKSKAGRKKIGAQTDLFGEFPGAAQAVEGE